MCMEFSDTLKNYFRIQSERDITVKDPEYMTDDEVSQYYAELGVATDEIDELELGVV